MATYYLDYTNGDDANAGTSEGVGNAWKTLSKALTTMVAGDHCYVKNSGTYQGNASNVNQGSFGLPIVLEGYSSTPGDGGKATADGESTRQDGLNFATGGPFWVIRNMRFTGFTRDGIQGSGQDAMKFENVQCDNNGRYGILSDDGCIASRCLVYGNTDGLLLDNDGIITDCVGYGNAGQQLRAFGGGAIIGCRASGASASTEMIKVGSLTVGTIVRNCTMDGEGQTGVVGLATAGSALRDCVQVTNCTFHDCDTGINFDADASARSEVAFCHFNSCNTDITNGSKGLGCITGAPLFTDEAGDDYTLQSGSPLKGAGLDAGWVDNGASYVDIGAYQREEPGAGTYPAEGDVELGSGAYGPTGTEYTPDFYVPSEANVLSGVTFGAANAEFTGSYTVTAPTTCLLRYVSATATTITVHHTPPGANYAITRFYYQEEGGSWQTGPTSTGTENVTITGLTAGRTYLIWATTESSVGVRGLTVGIKADTSSASTASDFDTQLETDISSVFLDTDFFGETVTYTFRDGSSKSITAVPHLNAAGSHIEMEAMFDISNDATIGVASPERGDTITQVNTTGQVWRVERVSENELGMVALVCLRIDPE